ncbi:MAG TPA: hypothetical protein VK753_08770 [Xanthomonadaceae bacterium]|jgi:hypothetical protein|nr:hypothetical protein [Xanthomonadaceae bacterium]
MRIRRFASIALACAAASQVFAAPDCSLKSVPQPLPLRATALPSLSDELPAGSHQLGVSDDVFAYNNDEGQAVDRVLSRLREEACRPSPPAGVGASGYVPRTKWDNTPYRFNAGGNGKKFTAADFDAWMKANGIHVSKGPPKPAPADSADQSAPALPAPAQPAPTQPE